MGQGPEEGTPLGHKCTLGAHSGSLGILFVVSPRAPFCSIHVNLVAWGLFEIWTPMHSSLELCMHAPLQGREPAR